MCSLRDVSQRTYKELETKPKDAEAVVPSSVCERTYKELET